MSTMTEGLPVAPETRLVAKVQRRRFTGARQLTAESCERGKFSPEQFDDMHDGD